MYLLRRLIRMSNLDSFSLYKYYLLGDTSGLSTLKYALKPFRKFLLEFHCFLLYSGVRNHRKTKKNPLLCLIWVCEWSFHSKAQHGFDRSPCFTMWEGHRQSRLHTPTTIRQSEGSFVCCLSISHHTSITRGYTCTILVSTVSCWWEWAIVSRFT